VTIADFTILANNFGSTVDPITGQLLQNDPTLAAAPTGDTNGDGVVDSQDLGVVAGSMGQNFSPTFEPGGDDVLTEAEAAAVEEGFAQAVPMEVVCRQCYTCPPIKCLRMVDWGNPLDGDPPDFDDGGDGIGPPGGEDDGPGGSGGPGDGGDGGDDTDPNGDTDGDGILNKDDCDSAAFAGGGGGGNCSDPCGDSDGDGTKNQDDCDSECHQNGSTRAEVCECSVTIEGCPTPDGLPENGVSPTEVIILPDDPGQSATVTLTATGDPGGGTYQWFISGAVVDHLDQPTITLTVTNPGLVEAAVTYTKDVDGQPCTARDRCEFLAWRCVIEQADAVVCLTDPPVPTLLTINPSHAPDAEIRWTVVHGSDHVTTTGGSGTTFEVNPDEPGEVAVRCELLHNGVVRCDSEVTLTIPGPVCGVNTAVTPTYSQRQGDPDCEVDREILGETVIDPLPIIDFLACIDPNTGEWTPRVQSIDSGIAVSLCPHWQTEISGPDDVLIDETNYCFVLADFTPVAAGQHALYLSYISMSAIYFHEQTHVVEWQTTFDRLWLQRESVIEGLTVACSTEIATEEDARTELVLDLLFARMQLQFDASDQWPRHENGQTKADAIENEYLAILRHGILQRAQDLNWDPCTQ